MVVGSLVAALIAVTAFVSVPVGVVPVTMQVMAVVLAALVLSPSGAFAATSVYLLLGAIGLPVFAGGRAGLAVLLGPTGGFLIGFVVGATLGAWVRRILTASFSALVADIAGAATVIVVVYVFGWLQLTVVTGMGIVEAAAVGVAPFLVWDVLKAAAAIGFAASIRKTGGLPSL
ncbi:MAG: biotin transporter BioY [Actinobacteria bacterium]|nr:MAG: biotin transporter BioY [Actinomycetota bacterium]